MGHDVDRDAGYRGLAAGAGCGGELGGAGW